jgi:hypothetical protein
MAGAVAKVRSYLRRMVERGKRCTSRSTLLARLRLTPSELEEALEELEREGVVAVGETEVCYTGAIEPHEDLAYEEMLKPLRRTAELRTIVQWYRVTRGLLPHVDMVLVRRDGTGFALRLVTGRLPPERLVAEARHLARISRRLMEDDELWASCCEGLARPKQLVPIVVVQRGAPRLVEGVPVQPLERARQLIIDPSPVLSDPLVRTYRLEPSHKRS